MKSGRCPYLGLKEDPRTVLDFPSEGNICHRAAAPGAVKAGFQRSTCLTGRHTGCPVYTGKSGRPLPIALRAAPEPIWMNRRLLTIAGLPLILLIIAGIVLALNGSRFWPDASSLFGSGQGSGVQESSGFNLLSPVVESTPAPVLIPVTSNQQPEKACPIPENWVPYEILPTDSLYRLSEVFGVPVEVLQEGNCLGVEKALMPGQILYVPAVITGLISPSDTPTAPAAAVVITPPVIVVVPAEPVQPERIDYPTAAEPPPDIPPTSVPPTDVPPTATVVPQPTATDPPPPVEPPPPDGGTGNASCNGDAVTVDGNDQTLTFTGICRLTVTGNNNYITVPAGTKIKDKGNGNVIIEQ